MPFSPVDTALIQVDQGVNAAASVAAMIPGVGPVVAGVLELGEMFVNAIGIRSGADEADVITKVQTPLGNALIAINNAIASASVPQLQTMFQAVYNMGQEFKQFVAGNQFTDGRASTQALNTIMPLIDGTGAYTSKASVPGCQHCGPTGPAGSDGTLGSINYRLQQLGAPPMAIQSTTAIMAPPQLAQGGGTGASFYTTLQSPSITLGNTTIQSGTLPNYPPSAIPDQLPAVVSTGFFGAGDMPLLVGAALLFLFLRRR